MGIKIPVFIFAGQSNMAGRIKQGTLGDYPSGAQVHESYDSSYYGPEYNFIRTMQANGVDELAIVKTSWGGTSVAQNKTMDWSINSRGELFDKMVADTLAMIQSLKDQGYEPDLQGMFWMQGEADAKSSSYQQYYENTKALIDAVRAALDAPDLPVYMGQIADNPTNPYTENIQADQERLADTMDNVHLIGTDGFEMNDNVHFSDAGDFLLGEAYADALLGHDGSVQDDRRSGYYLKGNVADNVIKGDEGAQLIHGRGVSDTLYGGDGDDRLFGDAGDDFLFGEQGNDIINGGDGNDVLMGGRGDDRLSGAAGNDRLYGGLGDDVIHGGTGKDILYGGGGNDVLYGDAGNDTLDGMDGDDTLVGGKGFDRLTGGTGHDLFYVDLSKEAGSVNLTTIVDFKEGEDVVQFWLKDKPTGDLLKTEDGRTVITPMDGADGQTNKIVFDHVIDVKVNYYQIDGRYLVELVKND